MNPNQPKQYSNTLTSKIRFEKRDKFKRKEEFNEPIFTVNDSEHFTFYRIPKLLFTDEIYQTVSTDAKMLYGLLLDRLSLSEKNDWKDEHGRVYQYFTIHQAQELLHFGHEKVCRLFAELDAADLIERRRQGQGKANRIYLKEFTQKSDYRNSRSPGIGRK